MTPWIDVKNGLPPLEERVLGWEGDFVDIFFLVKDRDGVLTWYDEEWIDNDHIKAWQPLPKPPGEKCQDM
jgi:hypothetical protein